jgi:hypothetical protein
MSEKSQADVCRGLLSGQKCAVCLVQFCVF